MKKIFNTIIYIIIIIFAIEYLSIVYGCKRPESPIINKKENVDVLFVGSSGTIRSISPMRMYEKKGISSYVIGASYANLPIEYYFLEENIKKNQPKVVILDIEYLCKEKDNSLDHAHYAVDFFPMSKNKLELINSEFYDMTFINKLTFVFPFFRFHQKWSEKNGYIKELKNIAIEPGKTKGQDWYGYLNNNTVYTKVNENYMKNNELNDKKSYNDNCAEEYILKVKKLCDEKNIKFILYCNVYPPKWSTLTSAKAKMIANDIGISLIDCNDKFNEMNLNFKTDFCDVGHLNISGAYKVTDYFSNYLTNNYNLANHQNEPKYESWNNDLKKYKDEEEKWIQEYNKNLQKQ